MDKYKLEKKIWTEADFEKMGWHDCLIYKIQLTYHLELDIDYILQWNQPEIEGLSFTFWVAPATLVFKNVRNIQLELDIINEDIGEIEDIELEKINNKFRWTIITRQGYLEFEAEGFTQWIRQEPFFQFTQSVPFIERYGVSLEQTTDQVNPNRNREDILESRKKDFEFYEIAQKRQLKRFEKINLEEQRESGEIALKDYLIQKRAIEEMLNYYNYNLNPTRFKDW